MLHTLVYAAFLEDPLSWVLLALGAALRMAAERAPPAGRPRRRVSRARAGAGHRMSRVPLVRPEFGPSLPELISGRFSVSRRAVAIGGVVALIVLVLAIKLATDDGREQLTVHGKPSFNVLYDPGSCTGQRRTRAS